MTDKQYVTKTLVRIKKMKKIFILILLGSLFYGLNSCIDKNHNSKVSSVSPNSTLSDKLLNSENITRTFAVVNYPKNVDVSFLTEHTKIIDGQSIGKVFKQHEWKIEKRNIYFGEILPSNDFTEIYNLMGSISPSKLAIYIYEFYVKKDGKEFRYATISEVYHPNYLTVNDLKYIYKNTDKYMEKTIFVTKTLKIVSDKMKINYKK